MDGWIEEWMDDDDDDVFSSSTCCNAGRCLAPIPFRSPCGSPRNHLVQPWAAATASSKVSNTGSTRRRRTRRPQSARWCGQSARWHSLEQYRTAWHSPHFLYLAPGGASAPHRLHVWAMPLGVGPLSSYGGMLANLEDKSYGPLRWMHGWMDGEVGGRGESRWMDGWMDGWMDAWINE